MRIYALFLVAHAELHLFFVSNAEFHVYFGFYCKVNFPLTVTIQNEMVPLFPMQSQICTLGFQDTVTLICVCNADVHFSGDSNAKLHFSDCQCQVAICLVLPMQSYSRPWLPMQSCILSWFRLRSCTFALNLMQSYILSSVFNSSYTLTLGSYKQF